MLLGAVSLLRGLQMPNRWAATQALFDYRGGLIKRGLFGATLGPALHLERYARFAGFSVVAMVVCCGMLALVARRLCAVGYGAAAAVFFGSYAVTYLGSLMGYMDVLLASVTCGLILIRNSSVRFAVGLPVCVAAVLTHELFLMVFLPVVLFTFAVDATELEGSAAWRPLGLGIVLLLACVGVTAKLALRAPLRGVQATAYRDALAGRADFRLDEDVFEVLTLSMRDDWGIMVQKRAENAQYRRLFRAYAGLVAPAVGLLLVGVWYALRGTMDLQQDLQRRGWLGLAALVAGLAPCGVNLFAYDVGRFFSLAVVTCFLVLAVVVRVSAPLRRPLPRWYGAAMVVAALLSLARSRGLIDGERPNAYPFVQGAHEITERWQRDDWKLPERDPHLD